MSVFNQLECLKNNGIITENDRLTATKIAALLPTGDKDLLSVIAAFIIMGLDNPLLSGEPIGAQSITSTGTGDAKTLTIPDGATKAVISVSTNNIIFRIDGVTPTVGNGHIGEVNKTFVIENLQTFEFISSIAASATVFVSYY